MKIGRKDKNRKDIEIGHKLKGEVFYRGKKRQCYCVVEDMRYDDRIENDFALRVLEKGLESKWRQPVDISNFEIVE